MQAAGPCSGRSCTWPDCGFHSSVADIQLVQASNSNRIQLTVLFTLHPCAFFLQVRVSPGLNLALLQVKLHQTLVTPGCCVLLDVSAPSWHRCLAPSAAHTDARFSLGRRLQCAVHEQCIMPKTDNHDCALCVVLPACTCSPANTSK